MQRRHTASVQRVGISARFDEVPDHVTLCRRIPVLPAGTPVGGVVERFRSSPVASTNVSASRNEQLGELSSVPGGSDVQRSVTAVHVVTDRSQEVRLRILAARTDTDGTVCEIERCVQPSRNLEVVACIDRTEERQQRSIVRAAARPTCLRHVHRLPDPTWTRRVGQRGCNLRLARETFGPDRRLARC